MLKQKIVKLKSRIRNYIQFCADIQPLGVPVENWLNKSDLMIGLICSSILINLLTLFFPIAILQIYDRIIPNGAVNTLYYLTAGIVTIIIIELIIKLARNYVNAWLDSRLRFQSALKAYSHYIHTDTQVFEKIGSGIHLEKLNALNTIKDFFDGHAVTVLVDVPFVIIFITFICFLDPRMAIIPIAMQAILVLLAYSQNQILFKDLTDRATTSEKKLNYLIEVFMGIHTVKALALESQMLRRYERLQSVAVYQDFHFALKSAFSGKLIESIVQCGLILNVSLGAYLVVINELSAGVLAACILLSTKSFSPMQKAISLWARFQTLKLAHRNQKEISALPLENTNQKGRQEKIQGEIQFDKISFKFSEKGVWLAKDMDLHVCPNETIAILSDHEKGKSTLLNLLLGIYKPSSGKILIDGHEINSWNIETLRRQISLLPQDGNLFEGTILENITLFKKGEYLKRAQALSKLLGLEEIIQQMPQGYHTKVGMSSVDLISKGIKQRILMIRTLIEEPKIILFDEANSSLDLYADAKLNNLLHTMKGKCTMVLITHRPSYLAFADKVYEIKKSKLVLSEVSKNEREGKK